MQNRRIHRLFIYNGICKRHNNKKPHVIRIFPVFPYKTVYFHTKNKVFLKKGGKTFGSYKKNAYLCIAIKGKAPWLN